ncbi:Flp family type IVb pilin [Pseudomonas sp. R5(2019)]|nr:Flp family type IVb pilin [Pseudomonas sp. R5(2019)]NBA95080.1 Flp family type IVb pilin [Pseudomonas sp. R5(2019)]
MLDKKLIKKIKDFFYSKEGASGIEYAIVAAMVAVVIAGLSGEVGTAVKGIFDSLLEVIKSPVPPAE